MQTRILLALTVCILARAAAAELTGVSFDQQEDQLILLLDDNPIGSYIWNDDQIPRPYFAHLRGPGLTDITRNHPPHPEHDADNDDHATYHPGAWLAFGDINGFDFWRNRARIRHTGFETGPMSSGGNGSFAVSTVYESKEDPSSIVATSVARHALRVSALGHLIECEYTFTAGESPIVFGDQEEMGFGIRLATPLTVEHGRGTLLNSKGGRDEAGTWGKSAEWCAGGKTTNGITSGAVVMAHPDNFRASWFHSRDYGLIVANPFGRKAMTGPNDPAIEPDQTTIPPGESLTLRFAVGLFSDYGELHEIARGFYETYTANW